ncbi:hypothetical protein MKX01_012208 [Papaver californicum]|nr:hypothetical protein MKX01_012208 [Papaver californicum]
MRQRVRTEFVSSLYTYCRFLFADIRSNLRLPRIIRLAGLGSSLLEYTTQKQARHGIVSDARTSFGMFLSKGKSKNPIVQAIEKRISVFSQVPVENGEPIKVLRYEKNQYFRLHHDYFSDATNFKESGCQRIAAMLMYYCARKMLKGSSVKPIKGDAVLFWSMGLDGKEDPNSVHTGCKVLSGEKWSATKLMRQNKYS